MVRLINCVVKKSKQAKGTFGGTKRKTTTTTENKTLTAKLFVTELLVKSSRKYFFQKFIFTTQFLYLHHIVVLFCRKWVKVIN